jgi:hypothetical protein
MDISARPLTVDFEGPDAEVFVRQALVRWTQPLSSSVKAQVAVENPSPEFAVPSGLAGSVRSRLPDAVGNVRLGSGFGHVQVAGVVRQLRFDGEGSSPDLTATGWGVNGTLAIHTFGKDELYGQAMAGEGVAHYVDGWQGQNADAVVVGSELRPLALRSFVIGYTHHWSERLRSGAAYAYSILDNDPSEPGSAPHRFDDARFNLFFLPHPHVDVAVEGLWGRRVNNDGAEGTAWRAQAGVIYHFGWKFTH